MKDIYKNNNLEKTFTTPSFWGEEMERQHIEVCCLHPILTSLQYLRRDERPSYVGVMQEEILWMNQVLNGW